MKSTIGLLICFGVAWGEYKNDGRPDLFLPQTCEQNGPSISDYRNNGGSPLTLVDTGLEHDNLNASQVVWGDYSCGEIDLFAGLDDRNVNASQGVWGDYSCGEIDLSGSCADTPGGGGPGQNSVHIHVGPGNAPNADLVRIEWPSGTVQGRPDLFLPQAWEQNGGSSSLYHMDLSNVASGQIRTVTEPSGEPQLASTRVNGKVQLTLTGKQGSSYDIQTSTDLANWTSPLNFTVMVTNPDGTATFPAPGATDDPQRFYRAALQ